MGGQLGRERGRLFASKRDDDDYEISKLQLALELAGGRSGKGAVFKRTVDSNSITP